MWNGKMDASIGQWIKIALTFLSHHLNISSTIMLKRSTAVDAPPRLMVNEGSPGTYGQLSERRVSLRTEEYYSHDSCSHSARHQTESFSQTCGANGPCGAPLQ